MKEDAKVFLRKIRIERSEIRILERKINESRLELLPGAIRYDLDKVQADPKDRMFEAIEKLAEYNIQLKKMIKKLCRDQAQAASYIAKIPESEQRQVLEFRCTQEQACMQEQRKKISLSQGQWTETSYEPLVRSPKKSLSRKNRKQGQKNPK